MKNILKISGLLAIIIITIIVSVLFGLHMNGNSMMNHNMMNHEVKSELEFIIEMIPHHQEAVDSSTQLLELGTNNEELRTLAHEIIKAQNTEIEMMNTWLDEWYDDKRYEPKYMNMMSNLEQVNEENRDNQYINEMIMHHQMAVVMARSVLTINNIRNETRILAEEIIRVQEQEIKLMKSISNQTK